MIFCATSLLRAQGLLPPTSVSTGTVHEARGPLLIGGQVPEALTLVNESAARRTLLSYKSSLDLLVVSFFSEPCDANHALWPKLRRLQENYTGWRVVFLAVSTEPGESPMKLPDILKHEGIPWPVLHDGQKAATALFRIAATPEAVIIDEFGVLRYRGPVSGVRPALDAMIGHSDNVKDSEPPMSGGCAS